MPDGRRRRGRGLADAPQPRFPRTARVNEVLRQVIADELQRIADTDLAVGLLTVTGISVEPDFRHAKVFLDSLSDTARAALEEHRVDLQAAISRQVRLKRTPLLAFVVDPAVSSGKRIDEILRRLDDGGDEQEP